MKGSGIWFGVVMPLFIAAAGAEPLTAQTLGEARESLRVGRYDAAITDFRRLARGADLEVAGRGLVRTLLEIGRYEEAEREARRLNESASPGLSNVLGEALQRQGKLAEAENLFKQAVAAASDSLVARLNLAILHYGRGEHDDAMIEFRHFIGVYNSNVELTSEELTAVAVAGRYLGAQNGELFKDALRVFDEAAAANPSNLDPRVRAAELFLEKYNNTDATNAFREILAVNPSHPRALLGIARSLRFDGAPGAMDSVRSSLESNPNFVSARVFLALLRLELEQYERAAEEAERALEVNPSSLEAKALVAVTLFLRGNAAAFEDAVQDVLLQNPRFADLYVTLAEASARNRLYAQAADFAHRAISLDSLSWRGRALLGVNQLRIGEMTEGRRNLEIAFDRDPFDVWTKNTLDLLDTFSEYTTDTSKYFEIVLHEDEADLLRPYMAEIADEAYETLARRYGHRPPTPIRLEVYPRHADFSVRTVGLAGLGALGVSFGPVLAMDSPSARAQGEFHWGSTLWHEVAHTFHLTLSRHRVPRWFTEGLAVFEERRARQGWGDDASVAFLNAYADDRLHVVSELNNGFVRPRYPAEVFFSYYLASLVTELIQRDWGDGALTAILRGYGNGLSTAGVFREVLDMSASEFDRHFERHMQERFAGPLAALESSGSQPPERLTDLSGLLRLAESRSGDFLAQFGAGRSLVHAERYAEAIPFLDRAKKLFPGYAAPESPYWYLALAHEGGGALRRAADELSQLTAINAGHYMAFVKQAEILAQVGDTLAAAGALDAAMYVYPFDMNLHSHLAGLHESQEQWEPAIRERNAVLALDPVDRAEAQYRLALAYFGAGDLGAARSAVLRALERAPNYESALDLLLEIRSRRQTGPTMQRL